MADRETVDNALTRVPDWLVALGVRSWLLVGAIAALIVVMYLVGTAAGLVVPLIVAAVIGMLFAPLVDVLERHHVSRAVGAGLVLTGLLLLAVLTVWVTIAGIIEQSGEIFHQVSAGLEALHTWFVGLDIPKEILDGIVSNARSAAPQVAAGIAGFFSSSLSGITSFLFGLFIGAFILFYMLSDWKKIAGWVSLHLGYPPDLGRGIVDDSTSAMRQYFKGLTISSILVSILIGLAMWALGLPLAFTIALVTFLTSYIPYLGAIFSGAFAFLVALGSGGVEKAIIVLVVILVTQNLVQTVVQNFYASEELDLHPLVTLMATILGSIFFGLLGATLGAPFAAMIVRTVARVKGYGEDGSAAEPDPDPAGAS